MDIASILGPNDLFETDVDGIGQWVKSNHAGGFHEFAWRQAALRWNSRGMRKQAKVTKGQVMNAECNGAARLSTRGGRL
jgi:hypothetical protein